MTGSCPEDVCTCCVPDRLLCVCVDIRWRSFRKTRGGKQLQQVCSVSSSGHTTTSTHVESIMVCVLLSNTWCVCWSMHTQRVPAAHNIDTKFVCIINKATTAIMIITEYDCQIIQGETYDVCSSRLYCVSHTTKNTTTTTTKPPFPPLSAPPHHLHIEHCSLNIICTTFITKYPSSPRSPLAPSTPSLIFVPHIPNHHSLFHRSPSIISTWTPPP